MMRRVLHALTSRLERPSRHAAPLLLVAVGFVAAGPGVAVPTSAQTVLNHDIVKLGERHGTPLPDGVLELLRDDPDAFSFAGAGFSVAAGAAAGAPADGLARIFGQYDGNVAGTFRFPALLGFFPEDGLPGESLDAVRTQFFDGPNATGTITEYFDEASNGRVSLLGEPFDWQATTLTRAEVTGGVSGLGQPARVGEFILELLVANDDGSVDWGRFDNDGPDGVPNSGDDDGRVDVLAVIHPTPGGECRSPERANRIWSHRWDLLSATGQEYVTNSPSATGGFIRVLDYTIQPVRNCADDGINDIGVFAHELGHGFGLPDLYATGGAGHEGIGGWGIMGTGSYGCDNRSAAQPCLPSAWTREQLGWGTFVDLAPDVDHGTLDFRSPNDGGVIYRYRVPDSNSYYLLEYRGRTGFDVRLPAEGLLVWQIDQQVIDSRRRFNAINSDPTSMGVWLRQADGENELGATDASGNRGDAGDPFPGATGSIAFHAGTRPASRIGGGRSARFTVTDITEGAGFATADVTTESATLTLAALGGSAPDLFTVEDRSFAPGPAGRYAPFEEVEVTAVGGIPVSEGVRQGFSGWTDGVVERSRVVEFALDDVTLTADYATTEFRVDAGLVGPVPGVSPGLIGATPSLPGFWFPDGTEVQFAAGPYAGFSYEEWTGALAGEPNPVTRRVSAPFSFDAVFSLDYGVASTEETPLVAGSAVALGLEVRGALGAVTWDVVSGSLPAGLSLDPGGEITGVPLETGTFGTRLRVRDSRGLTAEGDFDFEVSAPEISVAVLAGPMLGTTTVPTPGQLDWLDAAGNGDGGYDIGDALLYLRRGGGEAAAAGVDGLLRALTIPVPPDAGGESVDPSRTGEPISPSRTESGGER